jgi:hypothetical protein
MPLPHNFPLLPPHPSFSCLIDNRLPIPLSCADTLTVAHLLTPLSSSSKQTDFRNVASSHPYLGCSLICAPTRRRRRRHLSYMRRGLHVQQQNLSSDPYSPSIQQSSGPHSNLTSGPSFAISPHTYYRRDTAEDKTYHPCYSSLTNSSHYLRGSLSSIQKTKQKRRCTQSNQAHCTPAKDWKSHDKSPSRYPKGEGQKGPKNPISGQRHDRRVIKTAHDSLRH